MCTKLTVLLKSSKISFSYEVTPAVSWESIDNVKVEPTFYSVTWHAKIHRCSDLDIMPLKTARYLRSKGKEVLLHLSCDLLKIPYLKSLLQHLQEQGLCNLFVVLGESYDESNSGFKNSADLIRYIKATTGNYFCIGVTGYPDEERMLYIKEKVDAGADFIITQVFFEVGALEKFDANLRNNGIDIPIIPGVIIFKDRAQLKRLSNLCKVKLTDVLLRQAEESDVGLEIVENLLKNIIKSRNSVNLHFFTLNKLSEVSEFLFNFSPSPLP